MFFIHISCFLRCVLFYFFFIWLHVYAFAIKSKFHCGSAFEPGASGLPYYCTAPVCALAVIGALAVWWQNIKKKILRANLATLSQFIDVIGGLAVWRHHTHKKNQKQRNVHFNAFSTAWGGVWKTEISVAMRSHQLGPVRAGSVAIVNTNKQEQNKTNMSILGVPSCHQGAYRSPHYCITRMCSQILGKVGDAAAHPKLKFM